MAFGGFVYLYFDTLTIGFLLRNLLVANSARQNEVDPRIIGPDPFIALVFIALLIDATAVTRGRVECCLGHLKPTSNLPKWGKTLCIKSAVVAVVDKHHTCPRIRTICRKADCSPRVASYHRLVFDFIVQPLFIH